MSTMHAQDLATLLQALANPLAVVHVVISVQQPATVLAVPRWEDHARDIAQRLRLESRGWKHDPLARAVRAEMTTRRAEPGMLTRSGKVPSVASILRHVL